MNTFSISNFKNFIKNNFHPNSVIEFSPYKCKRTFEYNGQMCQCFKLSYKKNQIILETASGNRCEYSFYHPDDLKAILKIIQKEVLKNS